MENYPIREIVTREHSTTIEDDEIYLPPKAFAPTPLDTRFEGGPEQQPRDFDLDTMIY